MEECFEVPTAVSHVRSQHLHVEQITDIPVPQTIEERVDVPKAFQHACVQHRTNENFVGLPVQSGTLTNKCC